MSTLIPYENKASIVWDLYKDDAGDAFNLGKWAALSVTAEGVFDGAKVVIEGNNSEDGNMFILNDPNGYPLTFESEKIEQILEDCLRIRPRVIGGGDLTKLKVVILAYNSAMARPMPVRM